MRDHGGNLDAARAIHGDGPWIDLSTGINRVPYPVPELARASWTDLPTRSRLSALERAAALAYATSATIAPVAGVQAAIQLLPRIGKPDLVRILAPTYNEHAASWRAGGWRVEEVADVEALAGADVAILVNPNNPDGRAHSPEVRLALAHRVGRLIVDESFADMTPALSLAPRAGEHGLMVLRSFGKFYGLAGVRLGFVLGHAEEITSLRDLCGPWPISGAAVEIGCTALADTAWQHATIVRLAADAQRLDRLVQRAGWTLVGGTDLFRLYDTPDAESAQARLARAQIWSRVFPYSQRWLRLGLPGGDTEWRRIEAALMERP